MLLYLLQYSRIFIQGRLNVRIYCGSSADMDKVLEPIDPRHYRRDTPTRVTVTLVNLTDEERTYQYSCDDTVLHQEVYALMHNVGQPILSRYTLVNVLPIGNWLHFFSTNKYCVIDLYDMVIRDTRVVEAGARNIKYNTKSVRVQGIHFEHHDTTMMHLVCDNTDNLVQACTQLTLSLLKERVTTNDDDDDDDDESDILPLYCTESIALCE